MTIVVIGLMILGLATALAFPFLSVPVHAQAADRSDARDVFERDKAIAFMAIREAELDHAMGKLTEEDYSSLRAQYEERAVHALTALDALSSGGVAQNDALMTVPNGRFCVACGRAFTPDDRFCSTCGTTRASLV